MSIKTILTVMAVTAGSIFAVNTLGRTMPIIRTVFKGA